jgi:hypothetical protein
VHLNAELELKKLHHHHRRRRMVLWRRAFLENTTYRGSFRWYQESRKLANNVTVRAAQSKSHSSRWDGDCESILKQATHLPAEE